MENSILLSTKKVLNVSPDDPSFDMDILTFINSAFSTLHDLGVGPVGGLVIEDEDAEWDELGEPMYQLSMIKTYTFLRVRMLFDPPGTSYLINAMNEQINSHEWRLSVNRENSEWVSPIPPAVPYE